MVAPLNLWCLSSLALYDMYSTNLYHKARLPLSDFVIYVFLVRAVQEKRFSQFITKPL